MNKIESRRMLCESAFVSGVWQQNVLIAVDDDGIIREIASPPSDSNVERIPGIVLPGVANVHSHAFQRAFAGLGEFRTAEHDSFWTWRNLMYNFVAKLTPDDVYLIARQLYLEMLAAGYTWVGEFHYLHNDVDGGRYGNLAEMSQAVLRAASDAGIGICLLPVLYQRSGFDSESPNEGQRRFVLSDDEFIELLQAVEQLTDGCRNQTFGMAIHSLRAVNPRVGQEVIAEFQKRFGNRPIHIHVAEQVQEVDDCVASTGRRSVEHLFDEYPVDDRWCLIHSTHIDSGEIGLIAKSGAVAGLCPTTEANLGDGLFPATDFLEQGGAIAIGSDSHCSVDFRDELRTLEYGARLFARKRAVLGTELQSTGSRLFSECIAGGSRALGLDTGGLVVGARADLIVVDPNHPGIAGAQRDRALDRLIFVNAGNPVRNVMVGGEWSDLNGAEFVNKSAENARAFVELNQRLIDS